MISVTRSVPIVLTCMFAVALPLSAQRTVTRPGETITETATITKIDAAKRFVVLRGDDGSEVGVYAPPEFTRFDELRAGDRVTLTYYESAVFRVRPAHGAKPAVSEEVAATESAAALPGATFSHQSTATVTVEAVDRDAPSITVRTADRRVVSRKVEDRSLLDGIKRGDRIDITYTDALLATVTREQ
jgi:Cu/Ag efflux protein CusF